MDSETARTPLKPVVITPHLALDLRLRFIESLISPNSQSSSNSTTSVSLARRVSHIEAQLKQALESVGSTDALRRFVQNCKFLPRFHLLHARSQTTNATPDYTDDSNSPLLSVAPLPMNLLDSNEMPIEAKVSLILEAENEIKTLERDLREIEVLNQRGVVEAGKLPGELNPPQSFGLELDLIFARHCP